MESSLSCEQTNKKENNKDGQSRERNQRKRTWNSSWEKTARKIIMKTITMLFSLSRWWAARMWPCSSSCGMSFARDERNRERKKESKLMTCVLSYNSCIYQQIKINNTKLCKMYRLLNFIYILILIKTSENMCSCFFDAFLVHIVHYNTTMI